MGLNQTVLQHIKKSFEDNSFKVKFQVPHYEIPQFSSNYSILDSENSKPFY